MAIEYNDEPAPIGHNSDGEDNVAAQELQSFVDRVERLEEEKKQLADDIKDVYGESKSRGYDPKVIKAIITIRKQDPNERREFKSVLDTYLLALGVDVDDI